MNFDFIVALPPLLVLILGFATRRVMFSLTCGILFSAMIASNYSLIGALKLSLVRLWSNTELSHLCSLGAFADSDNLFIYIFLLILGIIVTLLSHSGGSYAYGKAVSKHLHSKRSAQASSLVLSMCLFVDDYFNSLTVGSVMYPLTDRFKIPRAKLAFLVDSMAAPLAMIVPVSSWVAVLVGFVRESGIDVTREATTLVLENPFNAYLHILPYVFYSFVIFFSAWFIVMRTISFGSMRSHEDAAEKTGNLFGGKQAPGNRLRQINEVNKKNSSLLDFIFPVATLIVCIIGGLLYSGNFSLFGTGNGIIEALQNADASFTLFVGGLTMLCICTIFFITRKKLLLTQVPSVFYSGIQLMMPSIIILLLSWTFGNILKEDLQTGQYLANLLVGSMPLPLLPAMFFVSSAIISFAIGSSWGTMAIMFPIAVPMVISMLNVTTPIALGQAPILLPVLGAILSGGVLGDHISPISDTTVMTSTSTGCHHIDHVQTQFSYALPLAVTTTLAFVASGYLAQYSLTISALVPAAGAIMLSWVVLELFNTRQNRMKDL